MTAFTKQDAEEFKTDIKRYMGILYEDFQHKLNIVIDSQMDIKRDVDILKQDVSALKEDVFDIKVRLTSVEHEMKEHRESTELHTQKAKTRKKAS